MSGTERDQCICWSTRAGLPDIQGNTLQTQRSTTWHQLQTSKVTMDIGHDHSYKVMDDDPGRQDLPHMGVCIRDENLPLPSPNGTKLVPGSWSVTSSLAWGGPSHRVV